jgi:SAM-dependent methyltransferase
MADLFGRIMKDTLAGEDAKYSIERDDGNECDDLGRPYLDPFPEWPEGERQAIAHAKGSVLDIGCGAGRAMLYLREQGYITVGIDMSPGAVKVCRSQGLVDTHVMSAENMKFKPNTFDTVLLFGNNFGVPIIRQQFRSPRRGAANHQDAERPPSNYNPGCHHFSIV